MNVAVNSYPRRALAVAAVMLGLVAVTSPGIADAAGATYFVAHGGSDAVACGGNSVSAPFASIQRALVCAGDGDVISLAPSGAKPYPGVGTVGANVTIKAAAGASARTVSIDASQGELNVSPGANAILTGVTLNCVSSCGGAPTVTDEGQLLLSADTVTGNNGLPNAAILVTTPDNSDTSAQLGILNSTVSGNASKTGGAIQTNSGVGATGASTLNITNSTIADNVSLNQGGGIAAVASTPGSGATITNTTITGNTASSDGGLFASSPVTLANTIIAANKVHSGTTDCQSSSGGSIITDGPGGHNLIGNATGCGAITPGTNNDQTGVSHPGLLALANNTGSTNTVALQAASPAIATGDPATCESGPTPDLDQRGHARATAKRGCDIGAFDTGGAAAHIHATFYVSSSGSDAVACGGNSVSAPFASIQRALVCAGDGDVISLAPSGAKPYPGVGTVGANVTIKAAAGASARTVSIDASQGELNVSPGANAILTGVTLNCVSSCGGAPTVTDEGQLLLSADTVTGNNGLPNAAILVTTPDNSDTSAQLGILNSTVSGNASKTGGAIQTNSGVGATGASTLNITNSTIADNVSLNQGGGIAAVASTPGSGATITNTTITGNTASSDGGLFASSPVTLANTIIAANKVHSGTTDCQSSSGGSIITDGPGGHNLIGNATGCGAITPGTNNDLGGTAASPLDPRLGPLAYNGGTTESEPPLAGGPAIGAGSAATCLQQPVFNVDQRRQTRNAAARDVCDIGADDTGGATPAAKPAVITAPASVNATVSSPLSVTVKAAGSPTPVLSESGALPAGVSFSDQGTGAALLSGTPAPGTAGRYPITISATNGNGSPASKSLVLNVSMSAATAHGAAAR